MQYPFHSIISHTRYTQAPHPLRFSLFSCVGCQSNNAAAGNYYLSTFIYFSLPVCLLHSHAFFSFSVSLCIILLKAWLLAVTVGEHVACGRHNFTSAASCASKKKKKKRFWSLKLQAVRASSFLFVCLLSCLSVAQRCLCRVSYCLLTPQYQWSLLAYMSRCVEELCVFACVCAGGFCASLCLCVYNPSNVYM